MDYCVLFYNHKILISRQVILKTRYFGSLLVLQAVNSKSRSHLNTPYPYP